MGPNSAGRGHWRLRQGGLSLPAGTLRTGPLRGEPADIDAALQPQKRDLLGHFCFYLHFAVMIFIVTGWIDPWRPGLYIYLAFLPLVVLQWQVNRDSCLLNNVEGWLRNRRWRNPENKEEGAWFLNMVRDTTGITLTPAQANAVNYGVVILLWLIALWHLTGWRR
jgi:hypothetical protein